uniref:Phage tail protein n=1 Tax=Panagrellus redivivus TaxID=6233 RepID=A0A7E5A1V9_PANRE
MLGRISSINTHFGHVVIATVGATDFPASKSGEPFEVNPQTKATYNFAADINQLGSLSVFQCISLQGYSR